MTVTGKMAEAKTQPAASAPKKSALLLSVSIPVYNEEEVLPAFHERLTAVLDQLDMRSEIVYVNDGSTDGTLDVMRRLREADRRVAIVDLSRNFGKEVALTAAINHSRGDAVVSIDADLQDPPELISEFVEHWRNGGHDVVYGHRIERHGESWIKKATASFFYKVMQRLGDVPIPANVGDCRLLSRRAVEALKQLPEQHRIMKGLFAWIGFSQKAVSYSRDFRQAGTTKWNYWALLNLAMEGFTSFSVAPLKIASILGLVVATTAFFYGLKIIYATLVFGDPVAGYPTIMVTILFLGGVQLISLGIMGEYLGRVFNETKRRPLYLVKEHLPSTPV